MAGQHRSDGLTLNNRQAAHLIGVGLSKFYELKKDGVLKGLEAPIAGRWSRPKLEAWLSGSLSSQVRGRRAVA